jgi:predicted DCC family thiol-disulfide oxidoreductase YuxK
MPDTTTTSLKQDLIFYDGLCGLCNKFVRFVLKRDRRDYFVFAPLQGLLAKKFLPLEGMPDSVILRFPTGGLAVKSEAVLSIFMRLSMPWPILGILMKVIPRRIRDTVYDFVARHRRLFFGRYEECPLPQPQWKNRFLDL